VPDPPDGGREAACPRSGPVEGVWGNREVPPATKWYLSRPVYGGAVLSGWQTVALSLGVAFLTGSFAFLVAWTNIRAQRREQLRVRRAEAASDFSKRFIGASDAVRYAIDHPDDAAAADNAPHLTGEVTPLLGPLSLLFGSDSETDQSAHAAFDHLRRAGESVKARDYEGGEQSLAASRASRERFEDAVRKVIE